MSIKCADEISTETDRQGTGCLQYPLQGSRTGWVDGLLGFMQRLMVVSAGDKSVVALGVVLAPGVVVAAELVVAMVVMAVAPALTAACWPEREKDLSSLTPERGQSSLADARQ